jgi:hypothetical protein
MPEMATQLDTYEELRQQAEACTGEVSSRRRIVELECRYGGVDRLLRIGEPSSSGEAVVLAIFQLGRDTYTIHHEQPQGEADPPVVLNKKDVYSVELD